MRRKKATQACPKSVTKVKTNHECHQAGEATSAPTEAIKVARQGHL